MVEGSQSSTLFGVDLRAATLSGLSAGLIFLFVVMTLSPALGQSFWWPPQMVAELVVGPRAVPVAGTFNLGIFVVGVAVHLLLSIVYAIVVCLIVQTRNIITAVAMGLVIGFVLYIINFYLFTGLFHWFTGGRNAAYTFAHGLYGAIVAGMYIYLTRSLVPIGERI